MKKVFNTIIIIASFLLLVILALAAVNDVVHFMDISTKLAKVIDFLRNYGPIIIVGALVFVNIIAKSVIRIIFVIIFLLALGLYIFASAFPIDFASLFGIA